MKIDKEKIIWKIWRLFDVLLILANLLIPILLFKNKILCLIISLIAITIIYYTLHQDKDLLVETMFSVPDSEAIYDVLLCFLIIIPFLCSCICIVSILNYYFFKGSLYIYLFISLSLFWLFFDFIDYNLLKYELQKVYCNICNEYNISVGLSSNIRLIECILCILINLTHFYKLYKFIKKSKLKKTIRIVLLITTVILTHLNIYYSEYINSIVDSIVLSLAFDAVFKDNFDRIQQQLKYLEVCNNLDTQSKIKLLNYVGNNINNKIQ